jgi:Bacterial protein of unknown function (DUF885)
MSVFPTRYSEQPIVAAWPSLGLLVIVGLLICQESNAQSGATSAETLQNLSADFWTWRATNAPFTADDVPRIERLGGRRDWSGASIAKRRRELELFESRWANIGTAQRSVPQQVDYEMLGSALARVRWELDINPRWKRDPTFYIEQTLTPLLEWIAVPGPFDERRSREILQRIDNIRTIIQAAEENLATPPAPFVRAAIQSLTDIRVQLRTMAVSLQPETTLNQSAIMDATERAIASLEQFISWLRKLLPSCPERFAIGCDAYSFFLHRVALLPYSSEELLAIGRQEAARATAFERFEAQRNEGLPVLTLLPNTDAWIIQERQDESAIRDFLKRHDLLSVPDWVQHYTFQATPKYVQALGSFGETDDFTSATRLKENATRYVDSPSEDLDFFWQATAQDPRPILLHEGVPGHYLQLALSWANEDPIRRHFYDSAPNEGLGFYCEEMMLQSGLFDDSPRTREIIYKFMLLRAIGIELDVKMATGEFTIEQGAAFLEKELGLGLKMGTEGATMFASWPGVLVAYQTGKTDILRFLADTKRKQGADFKLRAFHDFLWKNGNVPIALLRLEYLGSADDIERVHRLSKSQ